MHEREDIPRAPATPARPWGTDERCCWTCKFSSANTAHPTGGWQQMMVRPGWPLSCFAPWGGDSTVFTYEVCAGFQHRAD